MQEKTKIQIDLAIRAILGIGFAVLSGCYLLTGIALLRKIDFAVAEPHEIAHLLSVFSIGLYTFMIAALYVLRLRAQKTFAGFKPTLAALLGGFLVSGLLFLPPRTDLPVWALTLAALLVFVGNIFMVYILRHLGRSFSILPESRRLVTTGPYAHVRHPLYIAEAMAAVGAMITFWSLPAIILVAVQLGMQIARIHYEEKILTETFPDYADYARRVPRFIPSKTT